MILLTAIAAGIAAGLIRAKIIRRTFLIPELDLVWLAFAAFMPQFVVFYLPATRGWFSTSTVAALLVTSQALLLIFIWKNRRLPGMWILLIGLALNLTVILVNGGFMPISPETAARLVPAAVVETFPIGSRFGFGKDILLPVTQTRLAFLTDRYLLPAWFPRQTAFSLGDIFVAFGAFLFTAFPPLSISKKERASHDNIHA